MKKLLTLLGIILTTLSLGACTSKTTESVDNNTTEPISTTLVENLVQQYDHGAAVLSNTNRTNRLSMYSEEGYQVDKLAFSYYCNSTPLSLKSFFRFNFIKNDDFTNFVLVEGNDYEYVKYEISELTSYAKKYNYRIDIEVEISDHIKGGELIFNTATSDTYIPLDYHYADKDDKNNVVSLNVVYKESEKDVSQTTASKPNYITALDNFKTFWEDQGFDNDRVANDVINSFNTKCEVSGEVIYNNITYTNFGLEPLSRFTLDYSRNQINQKFEIKGVQVEGNSNYNYSNVYFNSLKQLVNSTYSLSDFNKSFEQQDNGLLKVTCTYRGPYNAISLYANYNLYSYSDTTRVDNGYKNTNNELVTSIQQQLLIQNFKFSFYIEMNVEEGIKVNGETYRSTSLEINDLLFNKSSVKVVGETDYSKYPISHIDVNNSIDITKYLG